MSSRVRTASDDATMPAGDVAEQWSVPIGRIGGVPIAIHASSLVASSGL